MALEFDGKSYRTIGDVTKELKTSVKKIEALVAAGTLPEWEKMVHGSRKFRYFSDDWMETARKYFESLKV